MGDLSENFSKREFACPCGCGFDMPASRLVTSLEILRGLICEHMGRDIPIVIASGNRCSPYNKACGGATASRHMRSDAADIIVPWMTPVQVMKVAETVGPIIAAPLMVHGFGGLGVGVSRIHVDCRPRKSARHKYPGARARWTYSNVKYDWKVK